MNEGEGQAPGFVNDRDERRERGAKIRKEAAAPAPRIFSLAAGGRLLMTSMPVHAPNRTVMPLPRKLMVAQLPAWLRWNTALSMTTPMLSLGENGPAEPGKPGRAQIHQQRSRGRGRLPAPGQVQNQKCQQVRKAELCKGLVWLIPVTVRMHTRQKLTQQHQPEGASERLLRL